MNKVARTSSHAVIGPQIRLAALSVYNWGSFHGLHTAQIDRDGTLITGDNGAGKSTLVDGLMALLLSTRASFNVAAAQGDRNDRTLVSYVRGSFGSLHDGAQTQTRYKRTGAVVSALRAKYCSDDGAIISLCGVFWTTQATNAIADFKRLYVVAERDLSLEELLDDFRSGDARKLKKRFRDDPQSTPFDSFTAYQERYRRLLHLDNRNAPSLLSRALGLKKIDDLTALVRELVLEPSGIREEAQKTVREFDDLVATHTQLVDARKRRSALEDLPDLAHQLAETRATLLRLEAERNGLAIFFAGHAARLWNERKSGIDQELNAIRIRLQEFRRRIADAATQLEARHADYLQAGGNRLEEVKRELALAKSTLASVTQAAGDYQKLAARADLVDTLDEASWHANKKQLDDYILHADADNERAQNSFADAASRLSRVDERLRVLAEEIAGIESHPDSNIDFQFQKLRIRLVDDLDIPLEALVFIGELIDVKPEHSTWQGAVERALGGLRTTLAVPTTHYHKVTRWLHSNFAGLHVRVQVVNDVTGAAVFIEDGYLRKLDWRPHPYREWLKHLLARFDLHCVTSAEALHDTPRSMTESGLIYYGGGRYEKKDQHRVDDRRQWSLGFSNKNRLSGLRKEKAVYVSEKRLRETEKETARRALVDTNDRHVLYQQLANVDWQMIDVPRWQQQVQQAQAALATLNDAHGNLATIETQWQAAKLALAAITDEKDHTTKREGECERRLAEAEQAYHQAAELAATPLDGPIVEALSRRIPALSPTELEHFAALEQGHRSAVDSEIAAAGGIKERAQNRAVAIMASFRKEWEIIAADWGGDVNSLDDYIEHLNELDAEGLPVLVEQFTERLNHCATQSLAGIRSRMESERDEISDRIETINRVLAGTEFRQGSYLQLNIKPETYPHVQAFNQALTDVFEHAGSSDQEKRFHGLTTVIEILEKASDAATAHTLESQRLIDPRYQLSFYAEELDSNSHAVIDVLHSSSGKSGGEKEAFAGTIVAAALAYVLTPEDGSYPIYCTVFLDEAFSNTAEAVSRRVLRVFRELNIHVNLITPFKNLNLARESARSLLIAERDPAKHESRLCEVTWEEIDRQIAQRKRDITEQAHTLGVVLENV